jgi:steroid delta-isomerase-like uncharacterized protein
MPAEEAKAITRRHIEKVINEGNIAAIDELFAPTIAFHDPAAPGGDIRGTSNLKQFFTDLHAAFDMHFTVEDMFAEGDRVSCRWTGHFIHRGEFAGIPPTGKQAMVSGMGIFKIAGGKIGEVWVNSDTLGLIQQLSGDPSIDEEKGASR